MTAQTPSVPARLYPVAAIAWYGLVVLVIAQAINGMDRTIVSYLVEYLKRDLHITDVQIGLLSGLAFALFYSAVGLPLGFISDLVSRKKLLIAGILTWSIATAVCGMVTDFPGMFIARLVVGLGEATLTPCAISMIADLFPSEKRARPLSVYFLGNSVSGGLAILVTGAIIGLPHAVLAPIPWLGDLAHWRVAFILCGALGIINAVMLALLPEVKRMGAPRAKADGLGLKFAAGYLRRHWSVFVPFYLGAAIKSMTTLAVFSWSIPFLMRHFHLTLPYIGAHQGSTNIVMAVIGSLSSAVFLTAVIKRGGMAARMKLAVWLPVLMIPYICLVFVPTPWVAFFIIGYSPMMAPLAGATLLGATAELVPAQMRGIAVSLFSFTSTIIGSTLGPLSVAMVTEHVLHDPNLVGWSILIVGVPGLTSAWALLLISQQNLKRMTAEGREIAQVVATNENRMAQTGAAAAH